MEERGSYDVPAAVDLQRSAPIAPDGVNLAVLDKEIAALGAANTRPAARVITQAVVEVPLADQLVAAQAALAGVNEETANIDKDRDELGSPPWIFDVRYAEPASRWLALETRI